MMPPPLKSLCTFEVHSSDGVGEFRPGPPYGYRHALDLGGNAQKGQDRINRRQWLYDQILVRKDQRRNSVPGKKLIDLAVLGAERVT